MNNAQVEKKKVIVITLILAVHAVLVALMFRRWDWAVGVASGTAVGLGNFYFLFRHLSMRHRENFKPRTHFLLFCLRYLSLALFFYLAHLWGALNFFGFLTGFILVQVSLGGTSLVRLLTRTYKTQS